MRVHARLRVWKIHAGLSAAKEGSLRKEMQRSCRWFAEEKEDPEETGNQ